MKTALISTTMSATEAPEPARWNEKAPDVKTYAARISYFNAYGPTENTITSTMGILKGDERGFPAAGRPLPNTSAHICDPDGHPLPPGVVGEIWLGGAGLAQGYLNRPELTEASFVETPRGRRYRTGDLGRWRSDGTIEIVGRVDDQVKLSGIRIELGEIEHALAGHPSISQAVALLVEQGGGSKSLWAVVRLSPGQQMPAEEDWHAHLTERLPSYMIPSGLIPVPAIPLTAAGKVDRSALLALLAERPSPIGVDPAPGRPRALGGRGLERRVGHEVRSTARTTSSPSGGTACWRSQSPTASRSRSAARCPPASFLPSRRWPVLPRGFASPALRNPSPTPHPTGLR